MVVGTGVIVLYSRQLNVMQLGEEQDAAGNAFNAMLKSPPNTSVLLPLALTIGISQIVRGVLQLGRNFGAELMAQKMERDIRDELYLSLLGKSMTFHNLQPVGDTMARSTNDVR